MKKNYVKASATQLWNFNERPTVGESLGSSDHNIIRLKLGSNKIKIDNHRLVPDYQRGDFSHFRQLLSNINWVHKFKGKTVVEMWGIFRSTIEQFQQICVPVKNKLTQVFKDSKNLMTSIVQKIWEALFRLIRYLY